MRRSAALALFVVLPMQAHAGICEGVVEPTVQGRSLDAWIADLQSPDRPIEAESRSVLRAHAGLVLSVIVVRKSQFEAPGHRQHSLLLPPLFDGAANAVDDLLAGVECENWKAREAAIQVLGWIGVAAKGAASRLVRSLDDPEAGVRMQAAFTLRLIGVAGEPTVAALVRRLGDPDEYASNAAALALASRPDQTLVALRVALTDGDPRVRRNAARALGYMKDDGAPALSGLLSILRQDTPDNQLEVIEVLTRFRPAVAREAAPTLVRLLEVPSLRCPAARLLAHLGEEHATEVIPVLIDLMRQPEGPWGTCPNRAYEDISFLGAPAVEPLIGLLRNPDVSVRRRAITALGGIQPPTSAALEAMAVALGDDGIRGNAGQVLGMIGAPAVPVLTRALEYDNALARREAAWGLARLGREAEAAGAKLVERLALEQGEAKEAVIAALGLVGGAEPRAAVAELRRLLDDPSLRATAAEALARIAGPDAADVAPILVESLQLQSGGMCPHPTAQEGLRAIGLAAVPVMVEALGDSGLGGGHWLLRVLDDLGTPALEQARPLLMKWLETPSGITAATRLQRLDGVASPRVIEIFTKALDSTNVWLRLEGAEGLARCDPANQGIAEPVLRELMTHEYEHVRSRAERALARSSKAGSE